MSGPLRHVAELLRADDFHGVILPYSRFRVIWDVGVLFLVVWTSISLPVFIAYPEADEGKSQVAWGAVKSVPHSMRLEGGGWWPVVLVGESPSA